MHLQGRGRTRGRTKGARLDLIESEVQVEGKCMPTTAIATDDLCTSDRVAAREEEPHALHMKRGSRRWLLEAGIGTAARSTLKATSALLFFTVL